MLLCELPEELNLEVPGIFLPFFQSHHRRVQKREFETQIICRCTLVFPFKFVSGFLVTDSVRRQVNLTRSKARKHTRMQLKTTRRLHGNTVLKYKGELGIVTSPTSCQETQRVQMKPPYGY